jgi:hypothetical protein
MHETIIQKMPRLVELVTQRRYGEAAATDRANVHAPAPSGTYLAQFALLNRKRMRHMIGAIMSFEGRVPMRSYLTIFAAAMIGCATAATAAEPAPATAAEPAWDSLVEVNSRRMGNAALLPGADFRPYDSVMLDKPEVSFRNNWLRDVNRNTRGAARVSQSDADRILEATATNTTDIFTAEFERAGFKIATAPGPNVLRVRTGVVDLFVNAPDVPTAGRSRTFTTNAGEATLVMEARDSMTNALLGRVIDRRETRGQGGMIGMQQSNRVTNTSEFRALARRWAQISATKLNDLKAASPVPDPLTPGQRIQ